MKTGTLWILRNPQINWLWYNLFGKNPVEKDLVVIVRVSNEPEPPDTDLLAWVYFVSLITGTEDFMTKQDFEQAFQPIGDTSEEESE
jgi:hypothetical protein